VRARSSVLNALQFPGPLGPVAKVEEPKIHPKSGTVGMANVVQTVIRTVPLPQEADIKGQRGPPPSPALVYQTLAYVAYDVNHLNIEWWSIGSGRGLIC